MKRRMIRLMACFMAAGILTAGQAVCPASAEEDNITILENATEQQTESEKQTETETEAAKKKKKKKKKAQTEAETEEDLSIVGQMVFAQCEDHINIRKGPGIDSDAVGKIYNDCMATVLSKDGEWLEIQSGNAVGFVKLEYFATGEEAQAIAERVGYHVATIYADELNIRALPDEEAEVIGVAYKEEEFEAVEYKDDWIKVYLGDDVYGYINAYYAGYDTFYPEAETLEEEQARLDAEAAAETEEEYVEEEYYEDEYLPEETYTPSAPSSSGTGGQSTWTPPQTEAQTQPQTQAQTQPQTQAQTQPQTEAQTQPQTQAQTSAPSGSDEEYDGEVNDDQYYDAATGQWVKF